MILGWYRDCGIIPHTTDVDYAMFIEDYELELRRAFQGRKSIRLVKSFGIDNEALELRFHDDFFQADLFFLYKQNLSHMYMGYHSNTGYYRYSTIFKLHNNLLLIFYLRQWYTIFSEVCSGDLLGLKILVPCEPNNILTQDYGTNWSIPVSSGGRFYNMAWNEKKKFSKDDWPKSRRIYDKNGKININETIKDLNEHFGQDGIVYNVTDISYY